MRASSIFHHPFRIPCNVHIVCCMCSHNETRMINEIRIIFFYFSVARRSCVFCVHWEITSQHTTHIWCIISCANVSFKLRINAKMENICIVYIYIIQGCKINAYMCLVCVCVTATKSYSWQRYHSNGQNSSHRCVVVILFVLFFAKQKQRLTHSHFRIQQF